VKGVPKNQAKVLFAENNFWGRTIAAVSSSSGTPPLKHCNCYFVILSWLYSKLGLDLIGREACGFAGIFSSCHTVTACLRCALRATCCATVTGLAPVQMPNLRYHPFLEIHIVASDRRFAIRSNARKRSLQLC